MGVDSYVWGWLIAMIVFAVIEGVTVQLVSVWFAIGSALGMVMALLDYSFFVQVLAFFLLSAFLLLCTRPLVTRRLKPVVTATNADSLIGKVGLVRQPIDNLAETGRVYVEGLTWMARSVTGAVIPAGSPVCIEKIEGAKVLVRLCTQAGGEEPQAPYSSNHPLV